MLFGHGRKDGTGVARTSAVTSSELGRLPRVKSRSQEVQVVASAFLYHRLYFTT